MFFLWLLTLVLILLALVFIWWPLWRRRQSDRVALDRNQQNINIFKGRMAELKEEFEEGNLEQATFDELQKELEQNLLGEVDEKPVATMSSGRALWAPISLSLMVPVAAFVMYLQWGASDRLALPPEPEQAANHPSSNHNDQSMAVQVEKLRSRLESTPDDAQGWFTLGRTYLALEQFQEAHDAFATVTQIVGEHAEILSQQAHSLYMLYGHQMSADVQALIDRSLELDAEDPGTLGLLGIYAYETGRYVEAIETWQSIIDSERPNVNRQGMQSAIDQALQQLAQQGIDYQPTAVADGRADDSADNNSDNNSDNNADNNADNPALASLRVEVTLSPELVGRTQPNQVVFIYAQAAQGPRMPLAVAKMKVSDLPARVTLDDSMAMGPMAKLSSVDQVQIKATVTQSGTPGAKSGDLLGTFGPVVVAGHDSLIQINIDQIVQ